MSVGKSKNRNWEGARVTVKGMDEVWCETSEPCLRAGGMVRCWNCVWCADGLMGLERVTVQIGLCWGNQDYGCGTFCNTFILQSAISTLKPGVELLGTPEERESEVDMAILLQPATEGCSRWAALPHSVVNAGR